MNRFRQIASLVFSLLLVLSTKGLNFYVHHCNASQKYSFALSEEGEGCCCQEMSSCSVSMEEKAGTQGNIPFISPLACCTDKEVFVVLDTDFLEVQKTDSGTAVLSLPGFFSSWGKTLPSIIPELYETIMEAGGHSPPVVSGRTRIYLYHQPKIPSFPAFMA